MQSKKKGAWRRTAAVKGKEERMGAYGEKDYDEEEEGGGEDDEEERQSGGAPWCRHSPAVRGGGGDGVLMAVARKADKLGYACFDEERSTIYVNELLVSTDLRETVQALKLHLGPTSFLIDAHLLADEDFCKLLGCAISEDRPQFYIKIAKARNWDFRRAITQLCTCLEVRELAEASRAEVEDREDGLVLQNLISCGGGGAREGGTEAGGLDPRRNYDRLSCVIDFPGEPLLVKALGALLVHLQGSVFSLEMGGRVPVGRLRRFDLGGFVRLDDNAFMSLQIFHEEKHPNVINGRGKAKEGFSLFSLLDQTRSRPGRKVLKEWMLRPLRCAEKIEERQVMVDLLLQGKAMEVVSNAGRLLGKVGNVCRALLRVKRAGATVNDWLTLADTAQHVLLLQNCLTVLGHLAVRHEGGGEGEKKGGLAARVVQEVLERISREAVERVREVVTNVVDLEITKESKVVAVRTGCDAELDRLRADYDNLEEFLNGEARDVLAEQASRLLSTVSVQFLPQVGFLVIVQASEKVAVENDPRFRFVFAEGESVYYKTPRMDVLDDSIGDLAAAIHDREAALLRNVGEEVLKEEIPLTEAVRACAEVDVLMSFAQLAGGLAWVKPMITEEKVLVIKDGRHPLQELAVEVFIPNDVFLVGKGGESSDKQQQEKKKEEEEEEEEEEEGGGEDKHQQQEKRQKRQSEGGRGLAVVTGPNFSGKSVYIKMVGVLTYLAHLGCFLPCQQALIGLVDGIHTRIASAETVTVQQSTFTIDCSQMNAVFRNATPSSLILVDEFGKGSAETDGLALLVASLSRLHTLGARALVTTHFLELFQRQGLLSPHLAKEISYRMDVFVPPLPPPSNPSSTSSSISRRRRSSSSSIQTIVPLFKLTKGVATSSDGFSCAALAGLALPLVKRAEHIAHCHVEGTLSIRPLSRPLSWRKGGGGEKEEEVKEEEEEKEEEGGARGGREVLRFNKEAQEVLKAFMAVEDWTECGEKQMQQFVELLQKV